MNTHCLRLLTLALVCAPFVAAQPADDTVLKQAIIFGRHSVRAPVVDNSTLNTFSALPYPDFGVAAGILTPHGVALETILGSYYRLWLTKQGLLTGNDAADAQFLYVRANGLQRTKATAAALAAALLPAATIQVNAYGETESDPLFDPVGAGVAQLDSRQELASIRGRVGDNPQSLAATYTPEIALTRSVLFGYPAGQKPLPAAPEGKVDVAAIPFAITGSTTPGVPVQFGGLSEITYAIDPFLMEYAEGLPLSDVAWGQLTPEGISQLARVYNLAIDLECRTSYPDQVQSSNLASHIVRTLVQTARGNAMPGALATPAAKVIVLIASDVNIAGLAGLFHLDWMVTGYPADFSSPGGAVVFELRQSQTSGEYIVRASYVTQTLDQLRNLTPLTLAAPPAIAPVFIPGCSVHNATFDCPLGTLVGIASQVIDPQSADLIN